MNDSRRRQVAMIKREITFTIDRLNLIEASEGVAIENNPACHDIQPLERLRDAVESLAYAYAALGQITEWH